MSLRTLARLILVLLLSFSTALSPVAKAAGEPAEQVSSGRFHRALGLLRNENRTWTRRMSAKTSDREAAQKSVDDSLSKKLTKNSVEGVSEVGRTMTLIMVLTGVELVHQEIQRARLEGRSIDAKHIEQLSLAAAQHLLTDGQIYSSIACSGAIGSACKVPLNLIQKLLERATSRRMLIGLIQSGIASFVTFTGWEAGSELWSQATLLIPNDKDFDRAKNLAGVLAGAARGDADDRRILGMLFDNMAKIILLDDELRTAWLYNTWRLHVATGQFVVLVGTMVSASAVGTVLFPGAGTLAGMMFGAVGGLASMAVPEDWKEDMTNSMRSMRRSANVAQLQADRAQVISWLEDQVTGDAAGFRGILDMQASMRSDVMTAYAEADYKRRVTIQSFQHEMETARQTLEQLTSHSRELAALYSSKTKDLEKDLREIITSHTEQIEKLKNDIRQIESGMKDFYSSEILGMLQVMKAASSAGASAGPVTQELKSELERLGMVEMSLTHVVTEGVDLQDRDLLSWIQVSNFRGFKEKRLLKALETAKP